ncbi:MAG: hypothetical protein H0X29_08735 [Parachlamydiaceae bacterium]|nr:hypothetical protein [Parachlamydiaceae bacterium]
MIGLPSRLDYSIPPYIIEEKFPQDSIFRSADIDYGVYKKDLDADLIDPLLKKFDEIISSQFFDNTLIKLTEFNVCLNLVPPSQEILNKLKLKRNEIDDKNLSPPLKFQLFLLDEHLFGRHDIEIINKTVRLTSEDRNKYRDDFDLTPQKKLAVEVSDLVDGYDEGPLRVNIHRYPGPDNLLLVERYLDEYNSGRRDFIFISCPQTSLECYQKVMLYVIDSLNQRHQYYQLHPDYLPREHYPQFLENFSENDISSTLDARFAFECYATQLESMREQVANMNSDNIDCLLDDFRDVYRKISKLKQNIVLSTGISYSVFSRKCMKKPVSTTCAPKPLKNLSDIIDMPFSQMGKNLNLKLNHLLKFLKMPDTRLREGLIQIDKNFQRLKKGDLSVPQEKELCLDCLKILDLFVPYKFNSISGMNFFTKDKLYSDLSLDAFITCFRDTLSLDLGFFPSKLNELLDELTPPLCYEFQFLEDLWKSIMALDESQPCEKQITPILIECLEGVNNIPTNLSTSDKNIFSLRRKLIQLLSLTPHLMNNSLKEILAIKKQIKNLNKTLLDPQIFRKIEKIDATLDFLLCNYVDNEGLVRNPNYALKIMFELRCDAELLEKEISDLNQEKFNIPPIMNSLNKIINSISTLYIPYIGPNLAYAKKVDGAVRTLLESLEVKKSIESFESKDDEHEYEKMQSKLKNKLVKALLNEDRQSLGDYIPAYYEITSYINKNSIEVKKIFSASKKALQILENIPHIEKPPKNYLSLIELNYLQKNLFELEKVAELHFNQVPSELNSLVSKLRKVVNQEEYFDFRFGESYEGTAVDPVKQCIAVLETTTELRSAFLKYQFCHEEIDHFMHFLFYLEISTSNYLVTNLNGEKFNPEALEILIRTAYGQNLITTSQRKALLNPESQLETLTEIRDNLLKGYSNINEHLLNDDTWHAGMGRQQTSPSSILQFQMDLLNGTVVGAIDRLIQANRSIQVERGTLFGKPSKTGNNIEEITQDQAGLKEEDAFDLSIYLNRAFEATSTLEKQYLHHILSHHTHQGDHELRKLVGEARALTRSDVIKPYSWKGKAFTLQDLQSLNLPGFTVPDVHILEAEQIFNLLGWRQEIEDELKSENFANIKELIMNKPLSAAFIMVFEKIWNSTQDQNSQQEVIVRSSSDLEDNESKRMAGLFESIGPVKTLEEGLKAFRVVLASAFSERATFFCLDKSKLFSMNIFLQSYVSTGTHSGVAFSVSDKHNWDNVALQITPGFGGGVDGAGNPTMLTVNTMRDVVVNQQSKDLMCLFPSTIKKIAKVTKEIEKAFAQPVEVEFVYDQNTDSLTIVQVAPITVL